MARTVVNDVVTYNNCCLRCDGVVVHGDSSSGLVVNDSNCCYPGIQDRLLLELSIVAEHFPRSMSSGTMDKSGGGADPDADANNVAEQALFGWPAVSDKPVWSRSERRFVDCYPLEFPMGVADMYEDRARPVSPWKYTQHMLRLASGQMANGLRGHRVAWSLVNSALLAEAQGKCFAVHRCMLRRLGPRVVGGGHLSKAQLRAMMEDKSQSSEMLRQLLTVGKDIRSTPMSWSYEAKKLDAAVKHLSWRQAHAGLCLSLICLECCSGMIGPLLKFLSYFEMTCWWHC
jgi:hypothetical protein